MRENGPGFKCLRSCEYVTAVAADDGWIVVVMAISKQGERILRH